MSPPVTDKVVMGDDEGPQGRHLNFNRSGA